MKLDQQALAYAKQTFILRSRAGLDPTSLIAEVIEAYQSAAPAYVPHAWKVSPTTKILAAMKIGDVQVLTTQLATNLELYYKTARKIINCPTAKWTAQTLPDRTVKVIRNPDGSSRRDPTRNPKAVELASLKIGESKISTTIKSARMGGGVLVLAKDRARQILDDPTAAWQLEMTTKGIRMSRVFPGTSVIGKKCTDGLSTLPKDIVRLLRRVAAANSITVGQIRSASKTEEAVRGRRQFCEEAARLGAYSHSRIARFIRAHQQTVTKFVNDGLQR